MLETLDRIVMATLGAFSMTREAAERIYDEAVRRGEAERANRGRWVDDIMDSAERARREMEEAVSRQVTQAVARLNLATRDDIARLEAKIDQQRGPAEK